MDAREILARLRVGDALTPEHFQWFAKGLADGTVSDSQAGAFAMAICKTPIGKDARVSLTHAMRDTGQVLKWDVAGPVVDKHSTGGVGDTVSLPLAPALAACGAFVPMLSGRGLGHTGGTLDKMEAIPGYRAIIGNDELQKVVREVGCAIVGASGEIAPADKRLYAVRDVTSTVESIDLITASILSKKLSEGLDALILDVKTGSGAFMVDPADALALAQSLVDTAQGAGCKCAALLTDMSQPLASTAGNAVEVMEAMEILTGSGGSPRMRQVTLSLGGELLALCGLAADAAEGEAKINDALNTGAAAEIFGLMVAALGGPSDFVSRWRDRLPAAPVMVEIMPKDPGHVAAIDTRAVGEAVVHLGGGRLVQTDKVDPAVGLTDLAGIGERVDQSRPLARIHARSEDDARAAAEALHRAYRLSDSPETAPALVQERIA
ncbi:thymidine phosphorylase [Nioella sediminis]|uniref:thymidine phosphorylase n=1 Tax=Nioella sediminis TaxID=1912092 RepID=UPI0008FD732C|nr:thymidine phosphorylase [Nioella sediminis]TBX21724.1 thymidine phosphorylase [Roseovarius sp. JS7-11]